MCLFFLRTEKSFVQENYLLQKSFAQTFRGYAQVQIALLVDDGFSSAHNALH
jgi:hypothetical protein